MHFLLFSDSYCHSEGVSPGVENFREEQSGTVSDSKFMTFMTVLHRMAELGLFLPGMMLSYSRNVAVPRLILGLKL